MTFKSLMMALVNKYHSTLISVYRDQTMEKAKANGCLAEKNSFVTKQTNILMLITVFFCSFLQSKIILN